MATLDAFAATHGITFPLLADEGGRIIRELGMLDDDLERHHAEFGRTVREDQHGVAYPAVFLLDRAGTVLRKRVHRNYRIRDTGGGPLESVCGRAAADRGPEAVIEGEAVEIRASLDSPVYRPYQQLQLTIELAARGDWHVYAPPAPDGYTPLGVEVDPAGGLEVGEPSWPAARPFSVEGLDDRGWVFGGTARGPVPLVVAAAAGSGDRRIVVTVRYQTCTRAACAPPAVTRFELLIREAPFAE